MAAIVGTLLVLIILGGAITCRPEWYVPLSVDHSRLKSDKQELMNLLDEIGDALNSDREIECELQQDQINRWITARTKMVPEAELAEFAMFEHPQIRFLDGNQVHVAVAIRRGGFPVVVSCACRVELTPTSLVVHVDSLRAGVLPVPVGWVVDWLGEGVDAGGGWSRVDDSALTWENDWTWPNGKPRFRIGRLEVTEASVRLRLEPR